jgi:hypothetical protein
LTADTRPGTLADIAMLCEDISRQHKSKEQV